MFFVPITGISSAIENPRLTDFLDKKKGFINAKCGGSDRNMNLNCEGLLE